MFDACLVSQNWIKMVKKKHQKILSSTQIINAFHYSNNSDKIIIVNVVFLQCNLS